MILIHHQVVDSILRKDFLHVTHVTRGGRVNKVFKAVVTVLSALILYDVLFLKSCPNSFLYQALENQLLTVNSLVNVIVHRLRDLVLEPE